MKYLKTFKLSITGRRQTNQDDCTVFSPNDQLTVLALADGMGGYKGGETASRLAIETAVGVIMDVSKSKGPYDLKATIKRIFSEADQIIRVTASQNSALAGMGTTLCCVVINNDRFAWGNLGDSRIYHFKNSSFDQITVDHSYLQQYIEEFGHNVPQNILKQSHVLTKALNGSGDLPDIFPLNKEFSTLNSGEAFLLCSDGLIPKKDFNYNNLFSDSLKSFENLEEAGKYLANKADQDGSTDNISLVLAEYGNIRRTKYSNAIEPEEQPLRKKLAIPASKARINKGLLKRTILGLFFLFIGLSTFWLVKNTNLSEHLKSNLKFLLSKVIQRNESKVKEEIQIIWPDYKEALGSKSGEYWIYIIDKNANDTLKKISTTSPTFPQVELQKYSNNVDSFFMTYRIKVLFTKEIPEDSIKVIK